MLVNSYGTVVDEDERGHVMTIPSRTGRIIGLVLGVSLGSISVLAQPVSGNDNSATTNVGSQETLTGKVACAAQVSHLYTCRKNDTLYGCALSCVQAGSHFVLVVGDKPYQLNGAQKELETFAGGKASVTGKVTGAQIDVSSVAKATR
jgi:hypothetical protein